MTTTQRLPYPGLRAFRRNEAALFFGRDTCIDDMADKLAATRFLAVLGTSGSGKSSIVRTGLFNTLELGLNAGMGSDWQFIDTHPGSAPFGNLAAALLSAQTPEAVDSESLEVLEGTLRQDPRALEAWCELGNLAPGRKLLVLVDQFEELFRYSDYARREEAEAFVQLLLEAATSSAAIHIVITMRSEYLGACSLIPGLAERINTGMYLTPRLTREQCREAIEGPAKVCGFDVEPVLVQRLLNDLAAFAPWEDDDKADQLERISRRADQLPLMQHVLNRMWLQATSQAHSGRIHLTLDHYVAIGGLDKALEAHGGELLGRMDEADRTLTAKIFRALIFGSGALAVRRPTSLSDLCDITAGSPDAVRRIVDSFRHPDCNFLVPMLAQRLTPETVIDLSHESLIRQWSFLADCVAHEDAARRQWARLLDRAELYMRREGELLESQDLTLATDWLAREKPTAAWAKRYGNQFDLVLNYVQDSLNQDAKQKARARAAERAKTWRQRLTVVAAGAFLAIAVMTIGLWYQSRAILLQNFADRGREYLDQNDSLTGVQYALAGDHLASQWYLWPEREQFRQLLADAYYRGEGSDLVIAPKGGVASADLSPDGKSIVTVDKDGSALVWDATTGKERFQLSVPELEYANSAKFSADGRLIVVMHGDKVSVWEASTGRMRASFHNEESYYDTLDVSRDGAYVAAATGENAIEIWDTATGRALVKPLAGHDETIVSVRFSPDGAHLVSASDDDTARVWDVHTGRLIATLRHEDDVNSASFSSDGAHVVTASDDLTARVWDADTGKAGLLLKGHTGPVTQVEYLPDLDGIVTIGSDETARLWDQKTGQQIASVQGRGLLTTFAVNKNPLAIFLTGSDGRLHVWEPDGIGLAIELTGHSGAIERVKISADRKILVTLGSDGRVKIRALGGMSRQKIFWASNNLTTASMSSTGLIANPHNTILSIWDVKTVKESIEKDLGEYIKTAEFSNDGIVILTTTTGGLKTSDKGGSTTIFRTFRETTDRIQTFNSTTGREILNISNPVPLSTVKMNYDGSRIIASGYGGGAIIDGWNGNILAEFQPYGEGLEIEKNGKRFATWGYRSATVWDIKTGKPIFKLGQKSTANAVRFSPNGAQIVSTSGDIAHIWDANTGKELLELGGHKASVLRAEYSQNGRQIVTASYDKTARVWDAETGNLLLTLKGHTGPVRSATFSLDGTRILTVSDDKSGRIWDARSGRLITVLPASKAVVDGAFSPDGSVAALRQPRGDVRVYKLTALNSSRLEAKSLACQHWLAETDRRMPKSTIQNDALLRDSWNPDTDLCAGIDGLPKLETPKATGKDKGLLARIRGRAERLWRDVSSWVGNLFDPAPAKTA